MSTDCPRFLTGIVNLACSLIAMRGLQKVTLHCYLSLIALRLLLYHHIYIP